MPPDEKAQIKKFLFLLLFCCSDQGSTRTSARAGRQLPRYAAMHFEATTYACTGMMSPRAPNCLITTGGHVHAQHTRACTAAAARVALTLCEFEARSPRVDQVREDAYDVLWSVNSNDTRSDAHARMLVRSPACSWLQLLESRRCMRRGPAVDSKFDIDRICVCVMHATSDASIKGWNKQYTSTLFGGGRFRVTAVLPPAIP